MNILIDMQGCQTASRYRGIGRYSRALVDAIIRNRTNHTVMLLLNGLFSDGLDELLEHYKQTIPSEHIIVFDAKGPVAELNPANSRRARVAELARERLVASIAPDVLLLTSLFEGFVDDAITSVGLLGTGPYTATILYDLIPYLNQDPHFPISFKPYYARKIESLKRADLLLSISDYAKSECAGAIPELADHIVNISSATNLGAHPARVSKKRLDVVRDKYEIARPFVMSVGNLEVRKNYEGLVRAFGLIPRSLMSTLQLVLVGGANDQRVGDLYQLARNSGLDPNQLRVLPHIPDADLVALYTSCRLFVFPSTHEGFGLPPLEAMEHGAAVIASNTTSLPEVIGLPDATFNPTSPKAISQLMVRALTEPTFNKSLIQHGLRQARKFSWDRTATVALDALQRNISTHKSQGTASQKGVFKVPMPRLAMVTPLPPEQTGIADYVAELLPSLSQRYEITIISDQSVLAPSPHIEHVAVQNVAWFDAHAHDFDRIVYQIGNSPFHAHMFDLLKRHPGVVVLHDVYLSSVFHWMEFHGNYPHAFHAALLKSGGYRALNIFANEGADKAKQDFPCNADVLCYSQSIIVHSQFSKRLIESHYGDQFLSAVRTAKLQRIVPNNVDRVMARRLLGITDDEFVVCAFGLMDHVKLNHRLLEAWAVSNLGLDKACKLVFVGGREEGAYGRAIDAQIATIDRGAQICITGFADRETYSRYLEATDAAVQLRGYSKGEVSGTILDCLSYGVPLIANAHGAVSEYPKDIFLMLDDDFPVGDLVSALERIKSDTVLRKHLATMAVSYVQAHHAPDETATVYHDAIESAVRSPEIQREREATERFWVGYDESAVGGPDTFPNNLIFSIHRARKRKLYLDISATARHDLKTGIERVARAYTQELLQRPPIGYDVEPVYLSNENGHWRIRKARRYLSSQLGFQLVPTEDELVLPERDDILFALDLFPDGVIPTAQQGLYTYWRASGAHTGFMVYDLLPIILPQFFPAWAEASHANWLSNICDNADLLVCISSAVKGDVYDWILKNRDTSDKSPTLEFCHLGADIQTSFSSAGLSAEAEATLRQLKLAPTFLMVGTIEPRKGYLQALGAFERLWQRGIAVNLVIVGFEGWKSVEPAQRRTVPEIVSTLRSLSERNHQLLWLEGISDEYLERLYQTVTCLIAASEGEGYGLPLIEAGQYLLPIIARDIPIFREVAGDAAYYFSGNNAEDIERAVTTWLDLRREGRLPDPTNLRWSTWRESAHRLKAILKRSFPSVTT